MRVLFRIKASHRCAPCFCDNFLQGLTSQALTFTFTIPPFGIKVMLFHIASCSNTPKTIFFNPKPRAFQTIRFA
jgi:hypothetical protein